MDYQRSFSGELTPVKVKSPYKPHVYPTRPRVMEGQASFDDAGEPELAALDLLRPRIRSQCAPVRASIVAHLDIDDPVRAAAPCPFVSCRYHLHVDRSARRIELHPEAPWEHTCVLDVVDSVAAPAEEPDVEDSGPRRLDELGEGLSYEMIAPILGSSHEHVRDVEHHALWKVAPKIVEHSDDIAVQLKPPRRLHVMR